MGARQRNCSSRSRRGHRHCLALAAALACACEINPPPNNAVVNPKEMDPYAGARTSGGEAKEGTVANAKPQEIGQMFSQLRGVPLDQTCAPAAAAWAILTYRPEVLDKHRVRTRELHCSGRVVDDRCTLVSEVRYYVDDPREYFAVEAGLSPEQALRVAKLARSAVGGFRIGAVAAEKRGVYLLTLFECGAEKQLATRIAGTGAKQRLEVIETRHSIEL
jgi:hypothetical protein